MHPGRAVVGVVVCVVVLVTVATATPLWTVPDPGSDTAPLGDGNATVSVVSTPQELTIEPGRQGGGAYYLRIPDATVNVTELSGNPLLVYRVEVGTFGKSRSAVYALAASGTGPKRLSIAEFAFEEKALNEDSYRVTVEIILRGNGDERVVYAEEFTAEVER